MMPFSNREKLNTKDRYEKKILACLETHSTLTPESTEKILQIKKRGINVNWGAPTEELEAGGMSHGGELTYVLSPVDSNDKYSEDYVNCLGIIVVGRNPENDNVSFAGHINADVIFSAGLEKKFSEDFIKHLRVLKERTVPGSVDIVFLGGEYPIKQIKNMAPQSLAEYWDKYEKAIKKIRDLILSTQIPEPAIAIGPKVDILQGTSAYFSNHERRLYVIQEDYTQGHSGPASDAIKLYKKHD